MMNALFVEGLIPEIEKGAEGKKHAFDKEIHDGQATVLRGSHYSRNCKLLTSLS